MVNICHDLYVQLTLSWPCEDAGRKRRTNLGTVY